MRIIYRLIFSLSSTLLFPFLYLARWLGEGNSFLVYFPDHFKRLIINFISEFFPLDSSLFVLNIFIFIASFLLIDALLIWAMKSLTLNYCENQSSFFLIKQIGAANSTLFGFYLAFYFSAFGVPEDNFSYFLLHFS